MPLLFPLLGGGASFQFTESWMKWKTAKHVHIYVSLSPHSYLTFIYVPPLFYTLLPVAHAISLAICVFCCRIPRHIFASFLCLHCLIQVALLLVFCVVSSVIHSYYGKLYAGACLLDDILALHRLITFCHGCFFCVFHRKHKNSFSSHFASVIFSIASQTHRWTVETIVAFALAVLLSSTPLRATKNATILKVFLFSISGMGRFLFAFAYGWLESVVRFYLVFRAGAIQWLHCIQAPSSAVAVNYWGYGEYELELEWRSKLLGICGMK